MGKRAEAGTPKHLANKMKAKGLQKLRWFCQMCQKQCRDENGFKCHTSSESHQRQLLLFAENPRKYLDEFSAEFNQGFMELLRRRFGTKRVHANQVYQEYISHKEHLHMNATRWLSLTGYVKFLGKTGKAKIDETEKGWFITYIDRDPETLARQAALEKKVKMDKDDDERLKEFIEKQVERAKDIGVKEQDNEFTELKRESEEDKIKLELKLIETKPKVETTTASGPVAIPGTSSSVFKDLGKGPSSSKSVFSTASSSANKRKKSALEEIIESEERFKEKKYKKDFWLIEGIVVKVVTKKLGDKYYKEKGIVLDVIDKYTGIIKMIETGHKIKLDQEHLETVIPSPGRLVKIVNGEYRGCDAMLKSVEMDKFCTTVEIISGSLKGKVLKGMQYEYISKLNQD